MFINDKENTMPMYDATIAAHAAHLSLLFCLKAKSLNASDCCVYFK